MFSKIGIAAALLAIPTLKAQHAVAPAAPTAAQIVSAKRVFVSNAGGDVNRNPAPWSDRSERMDLYSGGPERAYNQLYAAVAKNGGFELAATPAEADLVLEIRSTAPFFYPAKDFDPQIRLVVRDPKTHTALWGITEHVEFAALQRNRDKNFNEALDDIVNRFLALRAGVGSGPAAGSGVARK